MSPVLPMEMRFHLLCLRPTTRSNRIYLKASTCASRASIDSVGGRCDADACAAALWDAWVSLYVKSMLGSNPKRNSSGPLLKNLATVEDTEKDNYEYAQDRGLNPLKLVIAPSQPYPVSHRRCPYPRRSSGEAAEPMPSTMITSSILDATARIPRHIKPTIPRALERCCMRGGICVCAYETGWVNLRLSIHVRGARQGFHRRPVAILPSTRVMDKEGGHSLNIRVILRYLPHTCPMGSNLSSLKDGHFSGIWEIVATWHTPSNQHPHCQPSTYTIPYPFSPRPVPVPNSSSGPVLPGFTPASPPFPTAHCQKALFATGKTVVAVDWTCGSSGQQESFGAVESCAGK
ncbi:hypothetical protein BU17DRAFT_60095 [Hysterangium stoloniferum]|nr:hypothetical protein BU17DRAFT_60095 [Hysterangium stoloniferum]